MGSAYNIPTTISGGAGNDFIVDPGALIITLSSPRNPIVA